eukprot:gene36861-48076_t
MAKRLLLNVLVEFLGDYIEGLSEENLKLGIWSGKLELRNLALKVSTLHKLDLPLTALHGSVKNLKVTIPWTSLESSPVRIVIDGVYLLVGPLDLSTLSREDLKKHVASVKREILLNAERVVELASQTGTDSIPNRMVLKLTHREAATDNAPKLDVLIESTPFSILLEEQQFRQVLGVTHAFLTAERKKQIHVFRPTVPLHKSPKAWWLYAIRALSNKQRAIDK